MLELKAHVLNVDNDGPNTIRKFKKGRNDVKQKVSCMTKSKIMTDASRKNMYIKNQAEQLQTGKKWAVYKQLS